MILVTGAGGVLGEAFKKIENNKFFFLSSRKEVDLRSAHETKKFFNAHNFTGIIHLAAISGGIGLSGPKYQASLLRDNVLMLFNILDIAVEKKIDKTLLVLSSGMYSPDSTMPYKEKDIHNGAAHQSAYGYFYAKRLFEPAIKSYRDQYDLDVIGCVPNGIFGENDNFSEHAPMLPSIVKRAYEAKINKTKLVVWGDGTPLREYTYSEDMAKAFMWCYKNYSSSEIINVGSNEEKNIKEIVFYIADAIGLDRKEIEFDIEKPKGVFKKTMDNSKFISLSKFSFLELKDTIKRTVKWYELMMQENSNLIKNKEKN